MSAIDIAARLAGVPQDTIDKVEAAAPTAAKLMNLIKQNEPLIAQAAALEKQAMPLVEQAYAEIVAILPAAQDVAAFLAPKIDQT